LQTCLAGGDQGGADLHNASLTKQGKQRLMQGWN
jgi:hypothetical protein